MSTKTNMDKCSIVRTKHHWSRQVQAAGLLGIAVFSMGVLIGCSDKQGDKTAVSASSPDTAQPAKPVVPGEPPAIQTTESPSNDQTLTVTILEQRGAKKLTTDDILALIVDHSIVFQHLGTGEYFEAIYLRNGRRLLTNIDSGTLEGEALQDDYVVSNDKLRTEFKGTIVNTTIYQLDQRYLAAVDRDNGIVNYEIRDIVHTPLTEQVLKSQNARMLSSDEIRQLFVGKNLLIKDLSSGEEYSGYYGDDGIRILQFATSTTMPGEATQQQSREAYRIADDRLLSMVDGNEIATTIYQLESHYFGAISFDDGAVNFEFVPQ